MHGFCSLGVFDGLVLYEGQLESIYTWKLLTDESLSTINVLILQHFTISDCLLVILREHDVLHCNPRH